MPVIIPFVDDETTLNRIELLLLLLLASLDPNRLKVNAVDIATVFSNT